MRKEKTRTNSFAYTCNNISDKQRSKTRSCFRIYPNKLA